MANFNGVASSSTTNIVPVQAQFDANGNCVGLIGPGGALFSPPISGVTVNATALSLNNNLVATTATLPTIASGFGTSPTISAVSTFVFKIVVGTGGAANGIITFPAAPNGWIVYAQDVTSGTTLFLQQTASSTTSATLTSFSLITGLAANMNAADVILVTAFPY